MQPIPSNEFWPNGVPDPYKMSSSMRRPLLGSVIGIIGNIVTGNVAVQTFQRPYSVTTSKIPLH